MALDELFPLTPEERGRLDAAPWAGTDAAGWRTLAAQLHNELLAGYRDGEIDLRRVLQLARACALGCAGFDRAVLTMNFVERILQQPPPTRSRSGPRDRNAWLRRSAAELVDALVADRPDPRAAWAPNEMNDWSSVVLEKGVAWLMALGVVEQLTQKTLYEWWLAETEAKRHAVDDAGAAAHAVVRAVGTKSDD